MSFMRLAILASALLTSLGARAQAQTTLRIGIAEDPDILDPSIGRTYVGRIVFSAFCDKLFDIDEKLNIVPQLALSHETSADGKEMTIKLRPNVKFHDGEPLDAEAAKFSIERHMTLPTSFRKSELASVDHVEVVDPLTIKLVLKTPYSPLIAQLTDRSGMMVSPKAAKEAGDKFGLHPVCAGPYKFVERVQQDRMVFEKFADYWNKDNIHIDRVVFLPIVDATVRLANLKSGGLDLIERVLATDIKDVRADPEAGAVDRAGARLSGPDHQHRQRQDQGAAEPVGEGPPGARSLHRSRSDQPGRLQRRVHARQSMGQPDASLLSEGIPGSRPRHREGQGAVEGGRRQPARDRRLHGPQGRRVRGRRPGRPVDGRGSRLRHQDPRRRIRDHLQAGPGRRVPGVPDQLERPHRSRRQFLHLHAQQGAAERWRVRRTRKPTS